MSKLKFLIFSVVTLTCTGCVGPHATVGEAFEDNFILTTAKTVDTANKVCVTLSKPFSFQSGDTTFKLPKGTYVGNRANDEGTFYYAPSKIESTSWAIEHQDGIFFNNTLSHGYTFMVKGFGRPVRFAELPRSIYRIIKKKRC